MKGLKGHMEQYLPPDLPMAKSPLFCEGMDDCIFSHNSTSTEYNQPYMGPGLFFNRSSYPNDL